MNCPLPSTLKRTWEKGSRQLCWSESTNQCFQMSVLHYGTRKHKQQSQPKILSFPPQKLSQCWLMMVSFLSRVTSVLCHHWGFHQLRIWVLFSLNWCLAVWSMSCYSLTHFCTYQLPLLPTDRAAMWAILKSLFCGPVADAACLMRAWPWRTEVSLLPVRIRIVVCSCYGRTVNAGQFYIKFSRKNRMKLLQICRTVLHR